MIFGNDYSEHHQQKRSLIEQSVAVVAWQLHSLDSFFYLLFYNILHNIAIDSISMSNNTTSLLLPPSCLAPRSDAENAIVTVLGVLVILVSLYDYRTTFRSLYYAFSVRSTMCLMLLVPGLYAVLNIINVYINPFGTTVHLIVDSQALLRLLYLFSLIEFTISMA